MTDVSLHVAALARALKEDPEYWEAWKANIAMAFYDQAQWSETGWNRELLHAVANKAAENFLKILTEPR